MNVLHFLHLYQKCFTKNLEKKNKYFQENFYFSKNRVTYNRKVLPVCKTVKQGCRERPANEPNDTNFHSFIWSKEDGQRSWAHSLEYWNPSGGLSHALVMITTKPFILCVKSFLQTIYRFVLKEGVSLESLSQLLKFFFSLGDSSR